MARSPLVSRLLLSTALVALACNGGGGGDDGDDSDDTPGGADAAVADADPGTPDAAPGDAAPPMIDAGLVTASIEDVCSTTGLAVQLSAKLGACTGYPELLPSAAEISAACFGRFQPYYDLGYVSPATQDVFDACVAYLAAATCETLSLAANPCLGLVVGQVADGQTCFKGDGFVCGPSSYCGPPAVANFCETCSAKKPNNQSCTASDQCQSGNCTGTCQPAPPAPTVLAAGAACDRFNFAEVCPGAYTCRYDDAGTETICRLPPTTATDGKKCEDNLDCAAKHVGLYCNNVAMPGFSPDYRCKPPVPLGGMCAKDVTRCAEALGQDCVMGTCMNVTPTPPIAVGAECQPVFGATPCVFGARCILAGAGAATHTCEYENLQPMCAAR